MPKKEDILKVVFIALNLCAVNLRADIVPLAPNSNSIVQDGIEYYTQTDRAVYDLGEYVEMLHRVTNLRDENVTFEFANIQQCAFSVWDGEIRVWGWPKYINPACSCFTLQPEGFKEYSKEWDMIGDNGLLINPGIYDVSGQLMGSSTSGIIPESVSVPIQIIPEPATVLLLSLGSLLFTRFYGTLSVAFNDVENNAVKTG